MELPLEIYISTSMEMTQYGNLHLLILLFRPIPEVHFSTPDFTRQRKYGVKNNNCLLFVI